MDIGCGFNGSYERHQLVNNRSDVEILKDSFNELESCLKNINKKRGIGLYTLKEYISNCNGENIDLKIKRELSRIAAENSEVVSA